MLSISFWFICIRLVVPDKVIEPFCSPQSYKKDVHKFELITVKVLYSMVRFFIFSFMKTIEFTAPLNKLSGFYSLI